jgi:solute carrier family 35 protein E3
MIVMANKVVLLSGFKFPVALTLVHMLVTTVGLQLMACCGIFKQQNVPALSMLALAASNVGSIVSNNYSLHLNTVSFYQTSKLAITPTILMIEVFAYQRPTSRPLLAAVAVLMVGIFLTSVSDPQVVVNPVGMVVAAFNVIVTATASVWAGSFQRELKVNGDQLLCAMAPYALVMLAILVPIIEPMGFGTRTPGTILGCDLTVISAVWLMVGSVLGLAVNLSAFLFIGATSGTTYSVMGHVKTVLVLAAGVSLFGDSVSLKKVGGLCLALTGIGWYSYEVVRKE